MLNQDYKEVKWDFIKQARDLWKNNFEKGGTTVRYPYAVYFHAIAAITAGIVFCTGYLLVGFQKLTDFLNWLLTCLIWLVNMICMIPAMLSVLFFINPKTKQMHKLGKYLTKTVDKGSEWGL